MSKNELIVGVRSTEQSVGIKARAKRSEPT